MFLEVINFKKNLFYFRERGKEGEREEEKRLCEKETPTGYLLPSASTPRGAEHRVHSPGVCPARESNQGLLSLQTDANGAILARALEVIKCPS